MPTWFPNFLNLWPAAIAAAIAIPSLLILYFLKLRRREMPVSSTLLWKKAIQDLQVNAPFQRLRKNLLLFLQLLLLAFLLIALARPIVNFTPGAGKLAVILIDRSASMTATDIEGGRTRLDEAKRRAKELVGSMDRGASAMVIAFDDSATTVQPFTTDTLQLRQAIDTIQPTDRKSRLKLAYQLAEAQTNFNPEQLRSTVRPEVWVYSDGRVLDDKDLSIRGEIKYDRVGTDAAKNIAIVALSAKRNYERPTEVQVFARLANYSPEPLKADVQLSVDGNIRSIASTSLVPERWTQQQRDEAEKQGVAARDSVEFKIDLTTAAVIRVEQMNRQGDVLAADDFAEVVVPPPKSLEVLLVTDGNYWLEKIIQSLKLKNPVTMLPAQYEQNLPANFDVIVFDRHQPKQLPPAGSFIYFGTVPTGLKLKPAMNNEKIVVMPGQTEVLDWKRDHPMLRHLAMTKVYAFDPIKLEVPLESEVLVDGTKGPLIVLHREGRGTHLVIAFDIMQSNWPLGLVSWPVFMHNAMQFMAVGSDMDVRQSFEPGATPRIPRANLQRAGADLKAIRVNGPMGSQEIPIPETGDFALPALDKVGVYSLDPPIPQYEKLAVNLLDANESNLLPAETPPGGVGEAIAQSGGKSRLDLWWWIVACAALPLLMIEWWVYTRRVHL